MFHKEGETWQSDTHTRLAATERLLPARGQAAVEGSTRDQERLESQSGLVLKVYITGLGRKIDYLAWT